ncbi:MAG: DUF3365 domain-containing protein [Acidobacteria bacterium]|nr:DUF3365 domain-containing protein [Acidobacteriota bacterium]
MTPIIPLADPLPQPAPAWLLWALLQLTFFLHLLAMNVVLGGSVLALHWRMSRRPGDAAPRAAVTGAFAKALPVAVAAAVTLGVAPLLFVQVLYGRLFLTSSVLMAWWWLAVVPLVILAYSGAYLLAFRGASLGSRAKTIAAVVALLFLAVAFLYTSNVTRSLRPETFVEAYRASGRGFTLNLADPTLWPRYLHMLFGAVAVAGMAVAVYGLFRREREPETASWAMRKGTVFFGIATAVNIFVGMWFLLAQPKEILLRLVGADTWAMTLLALGILLGIATGGFALLALGARDAARATKAQVGVLLPTLVVMVLLRDQVRQLVLRDAGFEHPPWVEPQWGPLAVFALLLVAAVVTVAWMARALARGSAGGGATGTALVLVVVLAGAGAGQAGEPADPRVESAVAEARVAAGELAAQLKKLLQEELAAGGFDGAIAVCAEIAQQRTADYRETFKNDIRRVTLRRRNPENEPDDYERAVLESFDRLPIEARAKAEHWEVVTEDGQESLRYLKPLVTGALCLTCHGDPATMAPAVTQALGQHYPDDRATGFHVGDVRGAITIRIPLVPKP